MQNGTYVLNIPWRKSLEFWTFTVVEENITVKNCELYDNARDEQVGRLTGVNNRDASFVKKCRFLLTTRYTAILRLIRQHQGIPHHVFLLLLHMMNRET